MSWWRSSQSLLSRLSVHFSQWVHLALRVLFTAHLGTSLRITLRNCRTLLYTVGLPLSLTLFRCSRCSRWTRTSAKKSAGKLITCLPVCNSTPFSSPNRGNFSWTDPVMTASLGDKQKAAATYHYSLSTCMQLAETSIDAWEQIPGSLRILCYISSFKTLNF